MVLYIKPGSTNFFTYKMITIFLMLFLFQKDWVNPMLEIKKRDGSDQLYIKIVLFLKTVVTPLL